MSPRCTGPVPANARSAAQARNMRMRSASVRATARARVVGTVGEYSRAELRCNGNDVVATANFGDGLCPLVLPGDAEERTGGAALSVRVGERVAQHAPAALEKAVLDGAEPEDERRHREAELPVREGVNRHLLPRLGAEPCQRMPDIVGLAEAADEIGDVGIVDVARVGGLGVGGEAVVVEVPD